MEDKDGSIEFDSCADMMVFERDMRMIEPLATPKTEVALTIVDGEILFENYESNDYTLGAQMATRNPLLTAPTLFLVCLLLCSCGQRPADLILTNASVYTMEEQQPWASTVVITGNTITAVLGPDEETETYEGRDTRVIDMNGAFVMPGFIDSHTHFDGYGSVLNDADLMAVTENTGLIQELTRVTAILPEGEWITGGSWDGHRLWQADWRERERLKVNRWKPHRGTIDSITPHHPVFVNSWDRELYLANTLALRAAGLESASLPGMELRADGSPSGVILEGSPAIDSIRAVVAPKSDERRLNELRAGLEELARQGITEIHDITDEPYPRYYAMLQENGELTARIWMRLDLSRSSEIASAGIEMNSHPVTGRRDHLRNFNPPLASMHGGIWSFQAVAYGT